MKAEDVLKFHLFVWSLSSHAESPFKKALSLMRIFFRIKEAVKKYSKHQTCEERHSVGNKKKEKYFSALDLNIRFLWIMNRKKSQLIKHLKFNKHDYWI